MFFGKILIMERVTSKILQYLVLAPIIFFIFINDKSISGGDVGYLNMFADDAKISPKSQRMTCKKCKMIKES